MITKEYFLKYQKHVYALLLNALKTNSLSHAYLLSGESSVPLLDYAFFLAKSILCEEKVDFCCDNCLTCHKVDDNNYADLIIYDGASSTIKKEDVGNITDTFSKSSIESKGVMIYIIHLVDKMTTSATNALLKFLEEPANNVYAILTCENEEKVLPTIKSRTQILKLKTIPRNEIIEQAIESSIPREDAEILSYMYNSVSDIITTYSNEEYLAIKESVIDVLYSILNFKEEVLYTVQSKVIPLTKNKPQARMFFDILANFFMDIVNNSVGANIKLTSYATIINDLSTKLVNIDRSLIQILTSRQQLELNLNTALLIEHTIIQIIKE